MLLTRMPATSSRNAPYHVSLGDDRANQTLIRVRFVGDFPDHLTEELKRMRIQCDKCRASEHLLVSLPSNDGAQQAEETCPNCYIAEIERGERQPLHESVLPGAKDLPRTLLSDHIEQRLFNKLKQERQDRAEQQGKSYDEVPGAEGLVVRIVSSIDKKLQVEQWFLDIVGEENYPSEFPYKSKVVLLFQKIEGIDVCLFGMYVQEFGSECLPPNQRRVYLSCLDFVEYFQPAEVKAVTGEPLSTVVYHEILIGYLEYCKKRGFTSCYIWASPPLTSEDYILYRYDAEFVKTPKFDERREWYLAMLRKVAEEHIVVETTNLFDHFFVPTVECKVKVTASRLPYFFGDYCSGAVKDLINQLHQEKVAINQSSNASEDLLLMYKLGEAISPMKEDFIMVHLQHCCNHCCTLMVSGNRWVCNQCKNFQICDGCYEVELKREEIERHVINHIDKHTLSPVHIIDVPMDTKDRDEVVENEFFDDRRVLLHLCQGNHYHYDTFKQAKHSSMMLLYHLHNPTQPVVFATACNICHLDIKTGQGWQCEYCTDYDVCNSCYQKDGVVDHPHSLANNLSNAYCSAQIREARRCKLRRLFDALVHASQCRSAERRCQELGTCSKLKDLFKHGGQCRTRAIGGCKECTSIWYILQLHARECKESECHVPRCRDLKSFLGLQDHSGSVVMNMMRKRPS